MAAQEAVMETLMVVVVVVAIPAAGKSNDYPDGCPFLTRMSHLGFIIYILNILLITAQIRRPI